MKKTAAALASVGLALALVLSGAGPARATMDMQKKAKAGGFTESTNCLYCNAYRIADLMGRRLGVEDGQTEAMRRKAPMSVVIRDALRHYLRREPRDGPPGAGAFDSGHADTAERAEEVLEDLGFGRPR